MDGKMKYIHCRLRIQSAGKHAGPDVTVLTPMTSYQQWARTAGACQTRKRKQQDCCYCRHSRPTRTPIQCIVHRDFLPVYPEPKGHVLKPIQVTRGTASEDGCHTARSILQNQNQRGFSFSDTATASAVPGKAPVCHICCSRPSNGHAMVPCSQNNWQTYCWQSFKKTRVSDAIPESLVCPKTSGTSYATCAQQRCETAVCPIKSVKEQNAIKTCPSVLLTDSAYAAAAKCRT